MTFSQLKLKEIATLRLNFNDADDASGCGSDECGDDPSFLAAVAVAVARFALVKRQQFSRFVAAADFAGASCGIAFAAVASYSAMAGVGASFDADSAVWGCEEIDGLTQCR